jgi:uncharacterized membrane protein
MSYTPPSGPFPPTDQPQPLSGLGPQDDNDKIVAALSYLFVVLVSIVVLVTDMKNKPFLKYHAYQSLVFGIAIWILPTVLSFVFFGLCLIPFALVAQFYYAYLAYTKGIFTIPLISDLTRSIFKDFPVERPGTM